MFWYVAVLESWETWNLTSLGVAVSYLIIIGDLMPQVVRGFSEDLADIPYLSDRHFWITAFMLVMFYKGILT